MQQHTQSIHFTTCAILNIILSHVMKDVLTNTGFSYQGFSIACIIIYKVQTFSPLFTQTLNHKYVDISF